MARDPYTVLGVSKNADEQEIRKAYRKLAKAHHPDANPGDSNAEAKFKEAGNANEILSDKDKRAAYDQGMIDADGNQKAHNPFGGGGAGFGGQSRGGNPFGGFDDIGSVFEDLFSGGQARGGRGRQSIKGQDVKSKLNVAFLEAAVGAKRTLSLPSGGEVNLSVPAGTKTGDVLRLKGKGQQSPLGGAAGDLLVELVVNDHQFFKVEGDNLILDLPITLKEAVLGGKVDVPTLTGKVRLTIAPNTSSGKIFRLKGKGQKKSTKSPEGDLLVRIFIHLPSEEDETLTSLIDNWEDENSSNPRDKLLASV